MCSGGQEKRREKGSGLLTIAIMKILSKDALHGYAMLSVLQDIFGDKIDKASVYTVLRRLEEKGYVESIWQTSDSGPPKRVYRLTERGEEVLREKLRCLVKLIDVCKKILDY